MCTPTVGHIYTLTLLDTKILVCMVSLTLWVLVHRTVGVGLQYDPPTSPPHRMPNQPAIHVVLAGPPARLRVARVHHKIRPGDSLVRSPCVNGAVREITV